MCGIVGFFGAGDLDLLRTMNQRLVHRGPDSEGSWCAPDLPVFLAMRRLEILDQTGGRQPMLSHDGRFVMVFNGEIYNAGELRALLVERGRRFDSDHSDTETLLNAYIEWGSGCVRKLNGMWAFVVYDRLRQRLFCSRDRMGQKPFFYTLANGFFAFASELGALECHPKVSDQLDPLSIARYFALGFIPAPQSILKGVRKLPAGCHLELDLLAGPAARVRRYWRFQIQPEPDRHRDIDGWADECDALLKRAVKRRLVSDVPLGVFLSGGIDSSLVTHYAQASQDDPVSSFSIGFEEASFDESDYARRAADHVGTRHAFERHRQTDAVTNAAHIISCLDEPMGDSSILPTSQLCALAKRRVSVALGGDGADELFCGYDPFKALRAASIYDRLVPPTIHEALRFAVGLVPVSHRNMSLEFRLKRTLRGMSVPWSTRLPAWLGPLDPADVMREFGANLTMEQVYEDVIGLWDDQPRLSRVERTMMFFIHFYLADDILVKIDRASMAHSLEVRSPFLDLDLLDFIQRVPTELKFDGRQSKRLLRVVADRHLPPEIVHRPKKGFGVPIGSWFRDRRLALDGSPMVVPSELWQNWLHEHHCGKHDHRGALWNAWVLEGWNRNRQSRKP